MEKVFDAKRPLRSFSSIFYLCLGLYIVLAVIAPGFFTVNNSWNLFYNWAPLVLLAVGQMYVIITAGIDLSVTSIIALTSVAGGYVMSSETTLLSGEATAIACGILMMMGAGMCIGLFNGLAVTRFGMPAFMVTLASMMLFSGMAIWLTQSQNIHSLPPAFINMPYTYILGIPLPFYLVALVLLGSYYLLNKTLYGVWLYAAGLNQEASRISGVSVNYIIILAYVMSGLYASLAAMLYTARLETGSPVMGQNILLDVIGSVVIGGTSLFGGKGKISWTIFGALFFTMLDNGLNLMGLSYFVIMIVKGLVILSAVLIYTSRERSLHAT